MVESKHYQTTILTKYFGKYDALIFLNTNMHCKNCITSPKQMLDSQLFKTKEDIVLMLVLFLQLCNI